MNMKLLGIPGVVRGPPSMCGVLLTEKEKINEFRDWNDSDHDLYEEVIQKCIESSFASLNHFF